jgi:3'(2'), 5'-bisphosphate nucleotidase
MFNLMKELRSIAREAGAAIMEIYNSASDIEIELKGDDSPLTKADKAANDIICAGLKTLEVKHPIISEENKLLSYEERKHFTHCWMVDPLDGTKEFIKKNGEFTVNIALIEQNEVVLGVVYAPALDEMYWAEKDKGAYSFINGIETQLTASQFTMQDEGLRVVCSRSHLNEETQAFVDALTNPELVAKGSSLKFLILANKGADVYPRIAPTMEWDTAAAQIILEEAGGEVVQYKSNEKVKYNKEDLLNPFFVARGTLIDA